MALPPRWRTIIIDTILTVSWIACVAICCPIVQLASDRPMILCVVLSLAPGTLVFWGAVSAVQVWVAIAERKSGGR